jgi:DNA polymerase I
MVPAAMAEEALYLVDGSGFIFRAYHALPPLTTKGGVPSGAVYGFTQMMIKLELDHRPSHLAVVFDAGGRSTRSEMFADYKANRVEPPDDLKPQFGLVRKVVDAFGVPRLEAVDCEADDLIATLVKRAHDVGLRVVIVSSDKDLMQLVGEGCVLIDTMKPKDFVFGPKEVEEKFGVPPAQLGDVLALMGDSVDNIPGIPGVGPKTAAALIKHFGSLEALLGRTDEIAAVPGLRGAASVMAKVKANVEAAQLSRKLVALDEHIQYDAPVEKLRRHEPDMARVEALLTEMEFQRLLERLKPANANLNLNVNANLNPTAPAPSPAKVEIGTRPPLLITDPSALTQLAEELSRASEIGLAVESSGGPSSTAALLGIALASDALAAYVPVGHRYLGVPAQLDPAEVARALGPLLDGKAKHVHDAKDAEVLLGRHGFRFGALASDPMLSSYLIDPNAEHDLSAMAAAHLGAAIASRESLLGTGKKATPFESLEVARAGAFAAAQAEAALHLGRRLGAQIESRGVKKLLAEVELPLCHVLAVMERHGVRLDVAMLRTLGKSVDEKLHALETEVRALAGNDINLGSPKQLQELLFEKLGLPATKRTKTGFSTDADVLEELAPLHPIAAKILEHRVLAKLKGTYIDALPLVVDPKSGRLHTSYQQTIAATGRLSSTDPNLQNVPIRTELGKEIRRAFVADPGALLVVGDYSQIELRILAHLSKDPVLIDAFRKDEDIHARTVTEMFGAERADEPGLRSVAKMINYGIVYGLSDYGLAQRLGIERKQAREYIDNYLRTYSVLNDYMNRLIAEAHREGGAHTLLGRFRPIPELGSKNRNVRMYGERIARNTPVQGSAADLLKVAMIAVQRFIDESEPQVKMLLTVHDELVLEAPEARAEVAGERLKQVMESSWQLDVPLKVDLGIGKSWADAK